jgi:Flp pilus assembly protein TadG
LEAGRIAGKGQRALDAVAMTMTNLFTRFANDEAGAMAIEYGLIASLIAVAIIVAPPRSARS